MSLVPMLFSNWWEDFDRPVNLLDQRFGLGMRPSRYYRPWGELLRHGSGGSSVVKADKDQFKVALDVQQFRPDEVNVKIVDNCVIVEGKHEEKRDEHGWISRQFQRRYLIPDQCDVDQATSSLSSDGILSIAVPRKHEPKSENERVIKIEHTGKPALEQSAPQTDAVMNEENTGKK